MNVFQNILNILYPPLCLHCENSLEKNKTLFCGICLENLVPIDAQERCPTCFAEESPCKRCIARYVVIKGQAATCAPLGPARNLANHLDKGNTRFCSAVASLMALQWGTLEWPLPDLIVPLPSSLWARCTKGRDSATLLAKEVACLLCSSYASLLVASCDKSLLLEKARLCSRYRVWKRKEKMVIDKKVLLIALQLDDNQFRKAAEVLLEANASECYALAFIDQR